MPNSRIAVVLLVLPLMVAGCSSGPRDVARVNGEPISYETYCTSMQLERLPQGVPLGVAKLVDMISQQVMIQEARRLKAYPTQTQIDQELQQIRSNPAAAAAYEGLSDEQVKQVSVIPRLAAANLVLQAAHLRPGDVERYFNQHRAQYDRPESANILWIAVEKEADAKNALQMQGTMSPETIVQTVMQDVPGAGQPLQVLKGQPLGPLQPLVDPVFRTPAKHWTPIVRLQQPVDVTATKRANFLLAYVLDRKPAQQADLANPEVHRQVEMDVASTRVPRDYIQKLVENALRKAQVEVIPASLKRVEVELAKQQGALQPQ